MRRTLILARTFLAGRASADAPVAALLLPAALSAVFAGLVRTEVSGFAYALACLTLTALFVAIPLLGELSGLLRRDPCAEWVGALPVSDRELAAARALELVVALAALAAAPLLPAALLAPDFSLAARAGLAVSGLGVALLLAALLLVAQALLAGRAEGLFVLLQTALVAAVFLGMVLGVRQVPHIARLDGPGGSAGLALLPTAWFAAPFGRGAGPGAALLPLAVAAGSLALVVLLPRPRAPRPARGATLLELALAPLRRAATRLWVRADERGPFDLVADALPREREVVLRTYPMVGIPLAFLLAASSGEADGARAGLIALLCFSPGVYLPVLLTHVSASASHEARWILATSPATAGAVANGALKAVAVRFVLPLHALLAVLAALLAGPAAALRFALPGALVSVLVLRLLWPRVATDAPLSVPPDEVRMGQDWAGGLMGLAVGLAVAAALAAAFLDVPRALAATAGLAVCEGLAGRALRRRLG